MKHYFLCLASIVVVLPVASAQNIGINVQNTTAGANASTDVVATANNGSSTTNYVDLGINSSAYSGGVMGGVNDAHLFNVGQNFLIGTGSTSKSLIFLTGGTALATNERFRIDGSGNVGVGIDAPLYKLDVNGAIRTGRPSVTNGSLVFSNNSNANTVTINSAATSGSYSLTLPAAQGAASSVLTNNGSGSLTWASVPGAADWSKLGNSGVTASEFLGTLDDKLLIFKANNLSFLEFGRRQTLGLQDVSGQAEFADYQDGDEKVTYVRSALQFEAAAAQYYKPKMWTDVNGNFRVKGSSAGTDYFEFGSTGSANNGGFNFIIGDDGDEPMVFGSYDYNGPLNNGTPTTTEIMRLQSGRMAVGSNAFDGTNPEKLLIDAGTTTSYNLMTGKGSIDNYLQINVKNLSAGGSASSDIVASSNLGTESANFVDLGINSSGYTNTTLPVLSGAQTAYLYATGNDFVIGNATATKPLRFFTGGTANANERLRIDGTGKVGIGKTAPTEVLDITGNVRFSGALMPNNIPGVAGTILQSNGAGASPTWVTPATNSAWALTGNAGTTAGTQFIGTTDDTDLTFKTDGTEVMRLHSGGGAYLDTGVGATTIAGSAIYADGTYNNYLEINVKNLSGGNLASSDVVATANNGDSTAVYIDMGINSSGYSNTNANILNGANVAYLYAHGRDFKIGNGTPARSLIFFTNATAGTLGTNTANGTERMRIEPDGDVGIGTTNPSYKLEVNGSAAKTSGGLWTTASDKRLKKEIKPFTDGLEVLAKINPVWFQYNGMAGMPNDGHNLVGIIAQDMEKIAPYTIGSFRDRESNVDYLNYDANAVTYILINAVQEQQLIINATKKQLQDQDEKHMRVVDEMKKRLDEVSQRLLRLEEKKTL
jgi:hypothetical protein